MKRTFFENNKLVFIPAILPNKDLFGKETDKYSFFSDKSLYFYPNVLISAYHGKHLDIRKELECNDNVMILGDSGGFQAVTLGGDINAKEVIKWQMNNCNAGLILDKPPYKFGGTAQFAGTPSKEFFNECLEKTKQNALIALEHNKGEKKIRLYGVIQGETWEQMKQWYETISSIQTNEKKFDAWALSPKPSNDVFKIAMLGILCLEKKIDTPLHILQISNRPGIIVAALIRFCIQQTVTIDSSSPSKASRFGEIYNPYTFLAEIKTGQRRPKEKMNGWMCDCPICQATNISFNDVENKNYENILDLHNLYQIVRFVKYMDWVVQDKEILMKMVKTVSINAYNAIEMIYYYKEYGLERTKLKYPNVFESNNDASNQKGLFEF